MINRIINWYHAYKKKREERLWPERKVIVALNETTITALYPNGDILSADLGRLEKIEVFTNDTGPWGTDVWYVFTSEVGSCKYPQGATGEKAALDYMLNLADFNEAEFINAMGCTSNARFSCWECRKG